MENKKYILREAKVVYKKYKKVKSLKFTSPGVVYDWFKKFKDEAYERLITVYLNIANEVIAFSCDSEGCENCAVIYPRKVAKNALLNHAVRVLVVHNHPSGNPRPSGDDLEITKKLKSALETVEIEMIDHIIIGDTGYYSFQEQGLI